MQNVNEKGVRDSLRLFVISLALMCIFAGRQGFSQSVTITDGIINTAFQSGETAQYDLYYNWKFMWVKAGTGTISTTTSYYHGTPAYRVRILSRGSSKADKFFVLRDTLTSYMTYDLQPLFYTKTDLEQDKYRVRKVWFTYKNNKTIVKQQYIHSSGTSTWKTEESNQSVYDMASLLMRARSLDATKLKPGDHIKFHMTDGDGMITHSLVYQGKEKIKTKNGSGTFRSLKISFMKYDNDKQKDKEIGTFYVSDDANHLPIACFLYLKFGSARIYLSGYKNLKNPFTAKIK